MKWKTGAARKIALAFLVAFVTPIGTALGTYVVSLTLNLRLDALHLALVGILGALLLVAIILLHRLLRAEKEVTSRSVRISELEEKLERSVKVRKTVLSSILHVSRSSPRVVQPLQCRRGLTYAVTAKCKLPENPVVGFFALLGATKARFGFYVLEDQVNVDKFRAGENFSYVHGAPEVQSYRHEIRLPGEATIWLGFNSVEGGDASIELKAVELSSQE